MAILGQEISILHRDLAKLAKAVKELKLAKTVAARGRLHQSQVCAILKATTGYTHKQTFIAFLWLRKLYPVGYLNQGRGFRQACSVA